MIRVRVDDFPQTKGEPQHTLDAYRQFHRYLSENTGGKRYLLGVIPGRCKVEDLLFIRNETDVVVGLHGTDHDETRLDRNAGNQFESYLSVQDIRRTLTEYKDGTELAVGRSVYVYMPPRNVVDAKTVAAVDAAGFRYMTTGPETPQPIFSMQTNVRMVHSEPPHQYGRTDEMLARDSHRRLQEAVHQGLDVVLTLHWTWETNIGLNHMRLFLSQIPPDYFADFDA